MKLEHITMKYFRDVSVPGATFPILVFTYGFVYESYSSECILIYWTEILELDCLYWKD